MFCNRCGKKIEDESKFCEFCGALQEGRVDTVNNRNLYDLPERESKGIIGAMSAIDLVICALFVVIILWWTNIFFQNIKSNWEDFSLLNADMKFLGMILIIAPYIFVLGISAVGIMEIREKRYHMSVGVLIAAIAGIMKIGTYFFTEASFVSYEIIFYKMFFTYGTAGFSTIVLGCIAAGLTYEKSKNE